VVEGLVVVAQLSGVDIHKVANNPIRGESSHEHGIVKCLLRPALANESKEAGGVLLLPLPPDSVDHRVVQEENGICSSFRHVDGYMEIKRVDDIPLGDVFGARSP
jgi:hypothetical protein